MIRLALVFLIAFSTVAYADIIDPAEGACTGAEENDECTLGESGAGICTPGECCRNDYSGEGGDPETVCEACLICKADNDTPCDRDADCASGMCADTGSGGTRCAPSTDPNQGGAAGAGGEAGTGGDAPEAGSGGSEVSEGGSAGQTPTGGSGGGGAPEGGSGGGPGAEPAPAADDDSGCAANPTSPRDLGLLSIFVGFMLALRLRSSRK